MTALSSGSMPDILRNVSPVVEYCGAELPQAGNSLPESRAAIFRRELRKKRLVLFSGLFPTESFGGSFLRFAAQLLMKTCVNQEPRDPFCEVCTISAERHSAFARENIEAGVAQQLPISAAINWAEENYAAVSERFQALDVGYIVSITAYDHQRPIGFHSTVGVEQKLGIVFWFEAADVQEPLVRLISCLP